jgi:peroxiredoxin
MIAYSLFLLLAFTGSEKLAHRQDSPIGKQMADFELKNYQGTSYKLSTFSKNKLTVVAFLGADCPLANRYAARLAELAKVYEPRGAAFLGIDSNQQDSLAQLAQLAQVHKLPFPLLKDPGNVVADRFGAQRTPEVFVLDAGGVVR